MREKGAEYGYVERQSRAILSFQMMMCGDVEDVEAASSHLLLIAQVSPAGERDSARCSQV